MAKRSIGSGSSISCDSSDHATRLMITRRFVPRSRPPACRIVSERGTERPPSFARRLTHSPDHPGRSRAVARPRVPYEVGSWFRANVVVDSAVNDTWIAKSPRRQPRRRVSFRVPRPSFHLSGCRRRWSTASTVTRSASAMKNTAYGKSRTKARRTRCPEIETDCPEVSRTPC